MSRIRIRHLVEKRNRAGSVRYYWQPSRALSKAGWPTRRLPDDRGLAIAEAEAINANLDAARANAVRAGAPSGGKPATVAQLIAAFKAHRWYTDLKPKTRRWYDQNLAVVEVWAGDKPVLAIDRALVEELYVSLRARTPTKAAAVVRALGRLYEFGKIPFGNSFGNPAASANVKLERKTEPQIWPAAAVAAFVEAADRLGKHSVGDMIVYGEWLGHYASDLIALKRENYQDGRFTFRRSKTGAPIRVPHSPAVAARVEAALARQEDGVASDFLVLNEATGRPYADENAFGKAFREVRAAVAKKHPEWAKLWFMWLRHTAIVRLCEAECTDDQIRTFTGHTARTVRAVIERHYVQPTDRLADQAAAKRLRYEADKTAGDE